MSVSVSVSVPVPVPISMHLCVFSLPVSFPQDVALPISACEYILIASPYISMRIHTYAVLIQAHINTGTETVKLGVLC